MSNTHSVDIDAAKRVTDGNGREWAQTRLGAWACLGHSIAVDDLTELDARYIIVAVSA